MSTVPLPQQSLNLEGLVITVSQRPALTVCYSALQEITCTFSVPADAMPCARCWGSGEEESQTPVLKAQGNVVSYN